MTIRIKVDAQLCQGHGMCELEAPEVFRVRESEDGTYSEVEVINQAPDDALLPKIEAAVRFCPNRVLSIERD